MNPSHQDAASELSFADFVVGIAAVQADDKLAALDLAVRPPKFHRLR